MFTYLLDTLVLVPQAKRMYPSPARMCDLLPASWNALCTLRVLYPCSLERSLVVLPAAPPSIRTVKASDSPRSSMNMICKSSCSSAVARGVTYAYATVSMMGVPFQMAPCVDSATFCSNGDASGSSAESLSSAEHLPVRHHPLVYPCLNFGAGPWPPRMMKV
jgi:hypothetical protein